MRRLILLVLLASTASSALACGVAHTIDTDVKVTQETGIVYYDEDAKKEYLGLYPGFGILQGPKGDTLGNFDFGFLIPTPGRPDVKELSLDPFKNLANWIRPKTVCEKRWVMGWIGDYLCPTVPMLGGGRIRDRSDILLEEKEVGVYTVAILEATDPAALMNWLKEHAYNVSEGLEKWAKGYIEKRWYFCAFKISQKQWQSGDVVPNPFLVEFPADEPMFPFNEPVGCAMSRKLEASLPNPWLTVHVLMSKRVDGYLGDTMSTGSNCLKHSSRLPAGQVNNLLRTEHAGPGWTLGEKGRPKPFEPVLPAATRDLVLTTFTIEDVTRANAGDMVFRPSSDQSEFFRPPYVEYGGKRVFPVDLAVGVPLIVFLIAWKVLRRKKPDAAATARS